MRPASTVRLAIVALLVLVVLVGAGNLWASYAQSQSNSTQFNKFKNQLAEQQTAQQAAALKEVQALCTDLGTMALIQPPAGPAKANPSRAYEQSEHRAWLGLYNSIKCPPGEK